MSATRGPRCPKSEYPGSWLLAPKDDCKQQRGQMDAQMHSLKTFHQIGSTDRQVSPERLISSKVGHQSWHTPGSLTPAPLDWPLHQSLGFKDMVQYVQLLSK